jgi:CRISPR system Cascade subunit CasD
MQSWGVQSRFLMRDTTLEPSKSGVIGLLWAALGLPRDYDDIEPFNDLVMGVRVDRPGKLMMDYQTAQEIAISDDSKGLKTKTGISRRYFLSDACFLVGLEGEDLIWLQELHNKLREPHWPLFLGRKSYVPSLPVWLRDGMREGEDLLTALERFAWLGATVPSRRKHARPTNPMPKRLRFVIQSADGFIQRDDYPVTFDSKRRQLEPHLPRRVEVHMLDAPKQVYEERLEQESV